MTISPPPPPSRTKAGFLDVGKWYGKWEVPVGFMDLINLNYIKAHSFSFSPRPFVLLIHIRICLATHFEPIRRWGLYKATDVGTSATLDSPLLFSDTHFSGRGGGEKKATVPKWRNLALECVSWKAFTFGRKEGGKGGGRKSPSSITFFFHRERDPRRDLHWKVGSGA